MPLLHVRQDLRDGLSALVAKTILFRTEGQLEALRRWHILVRQFRCEAIWNVVVGNQKDHGQTRQADRANQPIMAQSVNGSASPPCSCFSCTTTTLVVVSFLHSIHERSYYCFF